MSLEAERAGLQHSLLEFLNASFPRNKWIYTNRYRIYIQRDLNKERFWLKTVAVTKPGKGTFKNVILPTLEDTLLKANYRELIVENVQTDRFANFFRKLNWIETTDGATYTFKTYLRP